MQLIATLALVLACGNAVQAAPNVNYGMQHQDHDGNVHWVAWKDGKGPCTNHAQLSVKTKSLCGQKFKIENTDLKFGDCNNDGFPRKLLYANGQEIRKCKVERKKIGCSGSPHDVVRRGLC
ncbi:hypothetical protein DTO027I6_9913 [Penicillium roqueforti]|nr:hypothetical protein CBS147337_10005 [Penicillium roqueforti]KAI3184749.1 hypothetical protein DTO027I6_9913 [Penicillium roqueforti]KAJ5046849.1 hypothetical protein NUH16_008863 [Penicillium rubens]